MKNSLINISDQWKIKRDEFSKIVTLDKSIDDEIKFNKLFCQEDLLWIKKYDFNLDLGWYGEEDKGHFRIYLYKGTDWHNCQLLEKRNLKDYKSVIKLINKFISNVDSGKYDSINLNFSSIDQFSQYAIISVLNE